MSISVILLVLLGGALLIPLLTNDDEDDNPRDDAIKGTPEDDPDIQGTSGSDLIYGFKGNDVIFGNGGEDEIYGGGGEDRITGGEDRDIIVGGADNDVLIGLGGGDTIEGGGGDDEIRAGDGGDVVRGGQGADVILGGTDDKLDLLRGEDGDDDIFIWGNSGTAFGGEGNDELVLMTGQATLDGVADDNVYYALANIGDTQQTVAIIEQFFLDSQDFSAQDKIVMTIDTDNPGNLELPVTVTVTEGEINGGISGYNIEVAFENPGDASGAIETARVFVLGTSVDPAILAGAIEVEVTLNASLDEDDAEQTLVDVRSGAGAPTQVVVPMPA